MKVFQPADVATPSDVRCALSGKGDRRVLACVFKNTISWADRSYVWPEDGSPQYAFVAGPAVREQMHSRTTGLDAFIARLKPTEDTQYILFDSFDEMVQYAVVHNLKWRA